MIVAGSKLGVGEDVIEMGIVKNPFGDDFFKQLAATLKEANGVVGFGEAVVGFGRFGNDNDKGVRPRVMSESDGGIEDVKETIRSRPECPFDKLV